VPRAILFDLDDTIIDSGGNVAGALREASGLAAEQIEGLEPGAAYDAISAVRSSFWSDPERNTKWRRDLRAAGAEIVRLALAELGYEIEPSLARAVSNRYRDLRNESYSLLPGAVPTLQRLRERGCRLGLVTNGSAAEQRGKIERFDLQRHFDHIQIEGEFGFGKPDPRSYLTALRIMDTAPFEAWFVGDHFEWDVAAPKRLGMYAVWVNPAGDPRPPQALEAPDLVVARIDELP